MNINQFRKAEKLVLLFRTIFSELRTLWLYKVKDLERRSTEQRKINHFDFLAKNEREKDPFKVFFSFLKEKFRTL